MTTREELKLVPAKFVIDEPTDGVFEGLHDPSARWNGWACPYFGRDAVNEIAETMASGAWGPEAGSLAWDGDTVVLTDPNYGDEQPERVEAVDVDGVQMWCVGAWGWVWEEWTDEEIAAHAEFKAADASIGSGR